MFILTLVPVLLIGSTVLSHDLNSALKFGDDLSSYIMLQPDMTPLQEQVSVCAWVKQVRPANQRGVWIYYCTSENMDEMFIADNLSWAYMLKGHISPSTTPAQSEWYHVCYTFSYSNRTKQLYYNGEKIGSETTPSGRKLSIATGSLVIGQYHKTYKMEASFFSGNQFGGELAKFNIFSRTLTDEEVAAMYTSGICSRFEDSLKEDTFLSWDTLLGDDTEKHGNIVKFNLTCPAQTHSEEPTTAQPTEEPQDTCHSRWGFLQLPEFKDQVRTYNLVVV